MLTARGDEQIAFRVWTLADDYIAKPFSTKELQYWPACASRFAPKRQSKSVVWR
jgi:DNA-binding response OmpR family regulator